MTIETGAVSEGSVSTGGSVAETSTTKETSQTTVAGSPASTETQGIKDGAPSAGQTPESTYQPNLKYKVLDKEKDFPEWAKSAVKSQEVEKAVRDILEKAEGLDHVKTRRDTLENENKQMKEHWLPVVQSVQSVMEFVKNKDFDLFFEAVGIPEIELFKYVNTRLQLRENPQQLAAHEQQRQNQLKTQELERSNQTMQEQVKEMAVQRRNWELDMELAKPDVSQTIQSFETRLGKPGAFRAEVIRRGMAYAAQGIDAPAGQIVQEMLGLIGWQGQQTLTPQATQGTEEPKATLPHLKGRGTSPTKVLPKSTEDLRKLAREMRA